MGGHPGPHISDCLVYDHANDEWSEFTPLPEGRAGGGLVYSSEARALIYSAGAERPEPDVADAVDYQHTWMYSFNKPSAGWVEKDDIPYLTNHMSYGTSTGTFVFVTYSSLSFSSSHDVRQNRERASAILCGPSGRERTHRKRERQF